LVQIFGSEKKLDWAKKYFGLVNIFGPEDNWCKKNFGKGKMWSEKKIGQEIFF
jgi:hypothetical protein